MGSLSIKFPHVYGFIGLGLIILSFIHWYLPFNNFNLTAFHGLFVVGNILFFDYLTYEFSRGNYSLLQSKGKFMRYSSHLIIIGMIFGFMEEFYLHWLGKFWYYPYWSFRFYWIVFIPAFTAYGLYIIETYLGIKAVIEHFFIKYKRRKESFAGLKKTFLILGLIGSVGLGLSTMYLLFQATFSNLNVFFSVNYAPFRPSYLLIPLCLTAIFMWFLFEYLEYERHETSMLYEMIKGNYIPVLSVFIAGWTSAIAYEVFNLPGQAWVYSNFPYSDIRFLNIPIFVLITWPLQYFPLFSLYRVIYKKETEKMWE